MFISVKDTMPFSKMSTGECKSLINRRGCILKEYTAGQILEMIPILDNTAIGVISKDGDIVDTSIALEDYINWKNT